MVIAVAAPVQQAFLIHPPKKQGQVNFNADLGPLMIPHAAGSCCWVLTFLSSLTRGLHVHSRHHDHVEAGRWYFMNHESKMARLHELQLGLKAPHPSWLHIQAVFQFYFMDLLTHKRLKIWFRIAKTEIISE